MRCGKKTVLASTCKAEATEAGESFKVAETGKSHKGCKSKSTERREPLANCGRCDIEFLDAICSDQSWAIESSWA